MIPTTDTDLEPACSPSIRRMAVCDASKDELLGRFDGARSAFMRRRILGEVHFAVYRAAYEAAMDRFCATTRRLNQLRAAGAL